MNYSKEKMIRVSKLYYEKDYNQQEVSDLMDMSRQTVGRILEAARENGIVQINVQDLNKKHYKELEQYIAEKFKLDQVIVEQIYDYSSESIRKALGSRGAEFLVNKIKKGQTLACSWGRTLLEVVNAMEFVEKGVDVVQFNGALEQIYLDINSSELARIMADKLGGNSYHLHAPGIVDSKKIRDHILDDGSIKSVLNKAKNADLAAIGIGAIKDSPLYTQDYIDKEHLEELKDKGVIGDLCLRMFDSDGKFVKTSLDDRIVGVTMEELNQIDYVVGIAGGENKVEAIKAVLQGDYLDVLITDSYTASLLKDQIDIL